jgi:hypothetical protein
VGSVDRWRRAGIGAVGALDLNREVGSFHGVRRIFVGVPRLVKPALSSIPVEPL